PTAGAGAAALLEAGGEVDHPLLRADRLEAVVVVVNREDDHTGAAEQRGSEERPEDFELSARGGGEVSPHLEVGGEEAEEMVARGELEGLHVGPRRVELL